MSQIEVKILADSVSLSGARLTTFELFYHRYFHSEVLTHRVISKNAASSRAIPSSKLLEVVENSPMLPISVGKNQAGMQATQDLEQDLADKFINEWKALGHTVAAGVKVLQDLGAHKQIVNRPLEAWLPIRVVATATDWDNFFELRDSKYAQPEFADLAKKMRHALAENNPTQLKVGEWHLPYVTVDDRNFVLSGMIEYVAAKYWYTLCALSASRCARVSHAIGGLSKKDIADEIEKGRELFAVKHMSPFEHIATPWDVAEACHKVIATNPIGASGALDELTHWLSVPNSKCPEWADVRNLRGWRQLRSFIEYGSIEL